MKRQREEPRIEIKKKNPKKRCLYYVGNFEFAKDVSFKKSVIRRKLRESFKDREERTKNQEWGTKRKQQDALKRAKFGRKSTSEVFEWECSQKDIKKDEITKIKCEGRPVNVDSKTSLVLLKIKDGVAHAHRVKHVLNFKRIIDVQEEEEDDLSEDEKIAQEKQQQFQQRLQKMSNPDYIWDKDKKEKLVDNEVVLDANMLKRLRQADEKELHEADERHKKTRTRGQREDIGDFEHAFTDDEDEPPLGDEAMMNRKEEDENDDESSDEDEEFSRMKKLIRDGVNPNAKKPKAKADDDDSDSEQDMMGISDCGSESEEEAPNKNTARGLRQMNKIHSAEVRQKKAKAEEIAKKMKEGSGLNLNGLKKLLQKYPQGIETSELLRLIVDTYGMAKGTVTEVLKPLLKKAARSTRQKGKGRIWFLKK